MTQPQTTTTTDTGACHADSDGDCTHPDCPQRRDGEPAATGRHCPRDVAMMAKRDAELKRLEDALDEADEDPDTGQHYCDEW